MLVITAPLFEKAIFVLYNNHLLNGIMSTIHCQQGPFEGNVSFRLWRDKYVIYDFKRCDPIDKFLLFAALRKRGIKTKLLEGGERG